MSVYGIPGEQSVHVITWISKMMIRTKKRRALVYRCKIKPCADMSVRCLHVGIPEIKFIRNVNFACKSVQIQMSRRYILRI
jgi:hypothetical protein